MMKLATSTLGCPHWDLDTILTRLPGFGYQAVDFRGLRGELRLWKLPEFSTGLTSTARRLAAAGLEVSCVSSGISLVESRAMQSAAFDEELLRSAEICAALGCGQIRMFGGALGCLREGANESDRPEAARRLADRAAELAIRARSIAPVDLLIETHDAWTASAELGRILAAIGRPDVACCWDIKHTWWAAGEVPATSWANLGAWVRNTHWKDARRWWSGIFVDQRTTDEVRANGRLGNLGEGVMPVLDALDLLLGHGYAGWYTLESEKRWHPYLAEPDIAFPAFVTFMRDAEAHWRSGLG